MSGEQQGLAGRRPESYRRGRKGPGRVETLAVWEGATGNGRREPSWALCHQPHAVRERTPRPSQRELGPRRDAGDPTEGRAVLARVHQHEPRGMYSGCLGPDPLTRGTPCIWGTVIPKSRPEAESPACAHSNCPANTKVLATSGHRNANTSIFNLAPVAVCMFKKK